MKTERSQDLENEPKGAWPASLEEIEQAVRLAEETIQLLDSDIFRAMLERGDIVLKRELDSAGNIKTLTVKNRDGRLFFFEDIRWFDEKLAERLITTAKRPEFDRASTEQEALEAVRMQKMKTIQITPETDPNKIN